MSDPGHVLIVGGGFSGTLLAINLLRHDGPCATIVERRATQVARGVAYSAAHPRHLLNVRAGNMSALPDDPGHFVRWLAARGLGDAATFVPRTTYGAYIAELLNAARTRAPDRLRLVTDAVADLRVTDDGVAATLASGVTIAADTAVLALGNLPPHDPPGLDAAALPAAVYAVDPWAADIAAGLGADDEVVLVGTGLTAIDAALLLDAAGFAGRVLAISRRGLRPHRHAPGVAKAVHERPAATLSGLVRHVRARAADASWRVAVDELRPVTQLMWSAADVAERARFLRHLRPYWDIHRHRLAPEVAERIDALVAAGRLRFVAGRPVEAVPVDGGVRLRWRPRGSDRIEQTIAARIVNCTGPQGDLLRSREPLIERLLACGSVRSDLLRLGLDVDAEAQVIDAGGRAQERLCAIGPMTRGGVWEIVAVPDIRRQVWDLARRLSHAQWVGGEGL